MESFSTFEPDYKTFSHNVKKQLVMFITRFNLMGGDKSEEVLIMTEQDKMEWIPAELFNKKFKRIKK